MASLGRLADHALDRLFGTRKGEPSASWKRERQRVFRSALTRGLGRDYERVVKTGYLN
jgi:hypothetical protein